MCCGSFCFPVGGMEKLNSKEVEDAWFDYIRQHFSSKKDKQKEIELHNHYTNISVEYAIQVWGEDYKNKL